jgi:hypothetical protein
MISYRYYIQLEGTAVIREIERKVTSGGVMLVLLFVATGFVVLGLVGSVRTENAGQAVVMALL